MPNRTQEPKNEKNGFDASGPIDSPRGLAQNSRQIQGPYLTHLPKQTIRDKMQNETPSDGSDTRP
jgi:hypothetical protein